MCSTHLACRSTWVQYQLPSRFVLAVCAISIQSLSLETQMEGHHPVACAERGGELAQAEIADPIISCVVDRAV
jgi:hypothetical protein